MTELDPEIAVCTNLEKYRTMSAPFRTFHPSLLQFSTHTKVMKGVHFAWHTLRSLRCLSSQLLLLLVVAAGLVVVHMVELPPPAWGTRAVFLVQALFPSSPLDSWDI